MSLCNCEAKGLSKQRGTMPDANDNDLPPFAPCYRRKLADEKNSFTEVIGVE